MRKKTLNPALNLSIIIPAYNEEYTIASSIRNALSVVERLGISHEVIVINDGSTDATERIASKENIRIFSIKNNLGKGNALRIGFQCASGLNIITVDADGAHRQIDLERLVTTFLDNNFHMLIGSRFLEKSKYRFTTPMNIVGNKLFKYLLFLISGKYITDSQSGLRIFRRDLLNHINSNSIGYEIEAELTAEAIGMGFKVGEIPIDCKPRVYGNSHLKAIKDGIKITKTIVKSYLLCRIKHRKRIKSQINA